MHLFRFDSKILERRKKKNIVTKKLKDIFLNIWSASLDIFIEMLIHIRHFEKCFSPKTIFMNTVKKKCKKFIRKSLYLYCDNFSRI